MFNIKYQISNIKITYQNSKILIFGLSFCILIFGFCSFSYAKDKIIAIVNDDIITQKDLNDFINFMRMQLAKEYSGYELEKRIQSMKKDLLDKLIEDQLILQEARKNNIKIDDNIIKARISEIKRRYSSDIEFKNDLEKQGLVQADLETRIREQLLMYNIIELKIKNTILVRPDEVTSFYNKNMKELITPEERELLAIALENADLAKTFAYNLKIGQKLVDLATRYPITVNKLKASKSGELRKDIEDTVFSLGLGEISDSIIIEGKYYVFKLENIIPSRQLTLSEAQDRIQAYLFEEKMQEKLTKWLDELKEKSYIKILQN